MSFLRFLKNLFTFSEPRRRRGPAPPMSKEDYEKEFELRKEMGKTRPAS